MILLLAKVNQLKIEAFSPDRMSIRLQVFELLSYKKSAQELIDAEFITFFNEEFLRTHRHILKIEEIYSNILLITAVSYKHMFETIMLMITTNYQSPI